MLVCASKLKHIKWLSRKSVVREISAYQLATPVSEKPGLTAAIVYVTPETRTIQDFHIAKEVQALVRALAVR